MKKIALYFATVFTAAILCSSCADVLDIDPSDRYSPAGIWGDKEALDKYVIGFYALIKEKNEVYSASNFSDAYSDIMKSSSWDQYNHSYNYALLQETYFTADDARALSCWSDCYNRIRRHNEFLRDAPGYMTTYGDKYMKIRMAEVRFIRGFAYYQLIRIYGGVVLRTEVDGPKENDKPRATEEKSWEQAIADMDYAAQNLPEKWEDAYNGRATKAAAYGMLSRFALYAKKWDLAVEAANACEELLKDKDNDKLNEILTTDYADIFANSNNPENLMVVNFLPGYTSSGITHQHDTFFRPIGDSPYHNKIALKGAFGPTSELVDTFEMENGDDFSWDKYGSDPYKNREPRFEATILYNGAPWEGRTIETYVGGTDGLIEFTPSGAAGSTTTGYYFRKFITEGETTWEAKGSSHFGIVVRFGEVLLNKAEALAEADWGKNSAEALETLNLVRRRVGLPDRKTSDKEQFMKYLRRERMVELAGEGFRYWDLRRWRMAVDVLNGKDAHGVKITKNNDTFNYEQIAVDGGKKRVFFERFYTFSLPLSELSNNKLIGENNPGW